MRGILLFLAVFGPAVCAAQEAQPQVPPTAQRRFWYYYGFEPQGNRDWFNDGGSWFEKRPDGDVTLFRALGDATVEGAHGLIVQRDGDQMQVFIPNCPPSPSACVLNFRDDAQSAWKMLGEAHFAGNTQAVPKNAAPKPNAGWRARHGRLTDGLLMGGIVGGFFGMLGGGAYLLYTAPQPHGLSAGRLAAGIPMAGLPVALIVCVAAGPCDQ